MNLRGWFRRRAFWERWVRQELALFPDEAHRREAVKVVGQRLTYGGYYFLGLMVVIPLLIWASKTLVAAAVSLLPVRPPMVLEWAPLLLYMALFVALLLSYYYLVRHRIERLLRVRLIELGVPVCLHCGYDFRGQTEPRCPECGRPFDPGLLRPPPGRAAERA